MGRSRRSVSGFFFARRFTLFVGIKFDVFHSAVLSSLLPRVCISLDRLIEK